MSVVGIIVFRSTQIVVSPDYSWAPVKAFNPSIQFLNALPLIVFAFHVRTATCHVAALAGCILWLHLPHTTPCSPAAC